MLDPQEAWDILTPYLEPLSELAIFRRHSSGRVTTRDLMATVDTPSEDISAMDGFALSGEVEPGEKRTLAGTIAAGSPPGWILVEGTVVRILTGAPIPLGADRVLQVELTELDGNQVVLLENPVKGAHIRRRAEVVAKGELLLEAESPLEPGTLALLATHGLEYVPVHRPPRVAFLTTGNEVVPPDQIPEPGQLRDSHTDFLISALHGMNLPLTPLGNVSDRRGELERRILAAIPRHEVVLLSGGVSRGVFDLVRDSLASIDCEILFHRVSIQPGKPLLAARHSSGTLIFGLPGNPAAVMVGFWLFVRPALRRLLGFRDGFWHGALTAELAESLPAAKGRDKFLPAKIAVRDGKIMASPQGPVGSHDLMAYSLGTGLVRIPANSAPTPAGAPCQILPLADWRVA